MDKNAKTNKERFLAGEMFGYELDRHKKVYQYVTSDYVEPGYINRISTVTSIHCSVKKVHEDYFTATAVIFHDFINVNVRFDNLIFA